MTDFADARRHMVDGQIRPNDVTDLRVLAAMLEVPRERFAPPASTSIAYLDLDLPVGTLRLKQGGGHGGHNGLRDIIAHLGDNFMRLRIGIGHPGKGNDVTNYVLNRPAKQEETLLHDAVAEALMALPLLLHGEREKAMQQLHTRV